MGRLSVTDFAQGRCDRPTKLNAQSVWMSAQLRSDLPPGMPLPRQVKQPAVCVVEPASNGVNQVTVFDAFQSDPTVAQADAAAEIARREKTNVVVCLGGDGFNAWFDGGRLQRDARAHGFAQSK